MSIPTKTMEGSQDLLILLNVIRAQGFTDDELHRALRTIYPNGYAAVKTYSYIPKNARNILDEMVKQFPLWFKGCLPYLYNQVRLHRFIDAGKNEESIKTALYVACNTESVEFFIKVKDRSLQEIMFHNPTLVAECMERIT